MTPSRKAAVLEKVAKDLTYKETAKARNTDKKLWSFFAGARAKHKAREESATSAKAKFKARRGAENARKAAERSAGQVARRSDRLSGWAKGRRGKNWRVASDSKLLKSPVPRRMKLKKMEKAPSDASLVSGR